ncbi:MAG: MarR family winged helix-turn-helix transcriptional regulator [Nocardioides sp.]
MNIDLRGVGTTRFLLPALAELPGHVVWRARQRVVVALEDVLPDSVDIHGYAALLALAGGVTRSQQALAQTVSVSGTTMMRVAADLADRGLVERVRNPDDRRSYALTRTPAGTAAARQWRRYAEEVEDAITQGFTPRERKDLRALLLRVVEPELAPDTPEPLRESIGFLITRLQFRMHREFQAALAPLGIEPQHFGILVALKSTGPISQSELARVFAVSGAHLVKVIDELESRELVARGKIETDRRAHVIELLPPGRTAISRVTPIAARTVQDRFAPLSAAQATRLVTLARRLVTTPA